MRCCAGFAVVMKVGSGAIHLAIRASLRQPGRRPELLWHLPLCRPSRALGLIASKQAVFFWIRRKALMMTTIVRRHGPPDATSQQ